MSDYELSVRGAVAPPTRLAGNGDPLTIGRDPTSHLSISHPSVSWSHARLWVEDGVPQIKDTGSRNGTRVNGRPVVGTVALEPGAKIELGKAILLELREAAAGSSSASVRYFVDDLDTGLRHAVIGDKFTLADSDEADLRSSGHPPAEIVRQSKGWWLKAGPLAIPVAEDTELQFAGKRLILRKTATATVATVGPGGDHMVPVVVDVWLSRSYAEIRSPGGQVLCEIRGESRIALLFVLAKEGGWCDEADLTRQVWGRATDADLTNRLKESVHRLRKAFKEAQLDTELIERKDGRIRLSAARANAHED